MKQRDRAHACECGGRGGGGVVIETIADNIYWCCLLLIYLFVYDEGFAEERRMEKKGI